MKLLIKWLICLFALLITEQAFPHTFLMQGGVFSFLAAATVLWLLNIFLRPMIQLVSLPISILTFGIFSLIVNAGMVALADWLVAPLQITSFWICIFLALLITAGNTLLLSKYKNHNKDA